MLVGIPKGVYVFIRDSTPSPPLVEGDFQRAHYVKDCHHRRTFYLKVPMTAVAARRLTLGNAS